MLLLLPLQRPLDEKGHLLWVDGFSFFKRAMGTTPNSLQDRRNFFPDDVLTDLLMIGFETGKILLIKKVAERSVTDIMQQTSKPEQFFDTG